VVTYYNDNIKNIRLIDNNLYIYVVGRGLYAHGEETISRASSAAEILKPR